MQRSIWSALVGVAMLAPQLQAQLPQTEGPFLQAFIFGDALFTATDQDVDDGFKLGQIVAHGNATLSEHVVFFGEISISARSAGYVLSMERAILRYDFNDAFKLSAGRYHTPISYWNTAFHHGLWLQGSVARPEAVRFGSRYIPVHFVGAMAEGNFNGTPLHYMVGFGNGRAENIAGAGDAGDINGDRAVILSVSVRPQSLFGFRVGGGLYFDQISDAGGAYADERIASAHVVWDRGQVEAIAEYIHVSHKPIGSDASTGSPAYYVHLGYRLPGAGRAWTPYARYENTDVGAGDIVFGGGVLGDYEAVVAGIRYDFDDFAALRAEYRGEKFDGGSNVDSYFVQASFALPVGGE